MRRKKQKKWNAMQAEKAARRKMVIAEFGTVAWRGRSAVFADKKKKRNKSACRRKTNEYAD